MKTLIARGALAGLSVAALATIVACGGGGSAPPVPGSTTQSSALFTIAIPSAATASSTQRHAAYISPNAQSISVAVANGTGTPGAPTVANLTPSSPNCTAATTATPLTCTISLVAPVGSDTFDVTLYAGTNATGSVLAASLVTATIGANAPTTVPVTLSGIVASIAVSVTGGANIVPGGYPTTLPVVVTAKDASGAAIVGSAPYASPITLTNADTSGVTTLSTTTVTSPATAVTLAYTPTDANGGVIDVAGLPVGETSIGASATGVAPTTVVPGTFQYIADRFFGYGHTRTLTGTGTVVTTTYNNLGTPSPSPSTYAYALTDSLVPHASGPFNGGSYQYVQHTRTYAQTSPATAASPEVGIDTDYRRYSPTATGAIIYRAGETFADTNSGTGSSAYTGYGPGTTLQTRTYPTTGGWELDALPHGTATWTNNAVPFTEVETGAEVSTFQLNADGSTSFTESVPGTIVQSQTASGTASNQNGSVTTTIGLPFAAPSPATGAQIPVAQETTSPAPGPTSLYTPADWYPGGDSPAQPPYTFAFTQTLTAIPTACNVPSSIATQAYVIVEQNNALLIPTFRYRQETFTDYYVPGGVGFVCEVYAETTTAYRYGTGTMSSQTVIASVVGVQSASSLGFRRR